MADPVFQLLDINGNKVFQVMPSGNAPTVDAVGSQVYISRTVVTSAQLLALKTTPLLIIPAPGAGCAIDVESISYKYNFLTAGYTLNAGTLRCFYGTPANNVPLHADLAAGLIDQAANRNVIGVPAVSSGALTDANGVNKDIFLGNTGTANFTVGAGTLDVIVAYIIVNL